MKWKIGWGLSNRCNMACKFCYSRKVRREQKNFDNIIQAGVNFVKHNKEKIDSINFGTGEPTVEPAFFKFCSQLKEAAPDVMIGVTTNGNLARAVKDNPFNMEVFINCIEDVDVSLDYGNATQQDESRNYEGAFQGVIDTLKLCKKYNKNTTIVSVMHKYNCSIENFESMIRIARLYDASFRINVLRPTVDFDFALPYADLKRNFVHLMYSYEVESIADPLLAALVGAECPVGDPTAKSSFRILPNGFVTPSTYLLDSNWLAIRIDEVEDIDSLHNADCFQQIKSVKTPQFCNNCPLEKQCKGGVFDRRWLWYHDFSEHDPYCPLRYEDTLDWSTLSGTPIYSQERKSFVHDGYLPTLIFNPSINERALSTWDLIYKNNANDYSSSIPEDIVTCANKYLKKDNNSVLDLGSGLGRNGLYYLSHNNDVTFVENSRIANDLLLYHLFKNGIYNHYSIIEHDISDYLGSESSDRFDLIMAMHIISHGSYETIRNIFISNIYRLLSSDGVACITLPSITDVRCPNHDRKVVEYALEIGPEEGIMHTFLSEIAIRESLEQFEILHLSEEKNDKGNSHWNVIIRKKL